MPSRTGRGVTHPVTRAGSSSQTLELLDEPQQMRVDDFLGGEDFLELPVVGSPAHPLWLGDIVADAAVRPELASQLEGAPQRPVMSRFALAAVGKPIRLARREGEGAVGQVEFRRSPSGPRADEPPPPPAERLGRGLKLDPVIRLSPLPVPSSGRVVQPHAPRFLAKMGLVADRADPRTGRGVRPYERAAPCASRPKEPIAEQFR